MLTRIISKLGFDGDSSIDDSDAEPSTSTIFSGHNFMSLNPLRTSGPLRRRAIEIFSPDDLQAAI